MIAPIDSTTALRLVEVVLGANLLLASLEYLAQHADFRPGGLAYGGATFRGGGGLRRVNRAVASAPLFPLLSAVRGLGAIALMAGVVHGSALPVLMVGLCALTVAMNMSFVFGTDASDQISLLVLFGLTVGAPFRDSESIRLATLWFIALHSAISYMSAGWSKLRIREWRDGRFVRSVATCELYGHPWTQRALSGQAMAVLASWATMGFEVLFFLAIVGGPVLAPAVLVVGFLFHLSNAVFMGLNRFVTAFLATYPALWFCGQRPESFLDLAAVFTTGS
ncbi:MAG: hypothetical protein AAF799_13515 [Myxococcota bacterium]